MTLRERITPAQIDDLRQRRVTGRALAAELGVTEFHLSRTFPGRLIGKIPGPVASAKREKRQLRAVRDLFRDTLALKIKGGFLTVQRASETAHCSTRTMYRHLEKLGDQALPTTRLP